MTQNQYIKHKQAIEAAYYSCLRSLLGNDWAMYFLLLGGREAGKSYSVIDFFLHQWREYTRPFYWLRLTEESRNKLLKNNAEKLIDPDLRRKYNIETQTCGDIIYEVHRGESKDGKPGKIIKKEVMCRCMALSTFYNDKGSGLYDKDFLKDESMYYNICLDEMNREQNERKTFDIVYAFANQIENIVRSTKTRLRIICIGNTLQEASDLLACFNFVPDNFGRYKLKSKRCIIEYIKPSEAFKERRKGSAADILSGSSSTFTNMIVMDKSVIEKKRKKRPNSVIMFGKDTNDMFTIWDGKIVAKYKNENVNKIAMRPYLDATFYPKQRDEIIQQFDLRCFKFDSMITFRKFQTSLQLLRNK